MLLKAPHVEIAGDRPLRIDIEFAVESDRAHGVHRRLRRGKHGAVAKLIEQLDRRWPDHAKRVAGARCREMDFITGRAVAEIGIETEQR